jgi:alkylhydroperoxidase/carboxymuconolactone decarboxylase family protein YurZ
MAPRNQKVPSDLPSGANALARHHPQIWESYAELGERCVKGGPLDRRVTRLVKIALATGAGTEGGLHSHVRRGLAEGLSPDEIRHIGLLAIPTLGLPAAVRAMTWMEDILQRKPGTKGAERRPK